MLVPVKWERERSAQIYPAEAPAPRMAARFGRYHVDGRDVLLFIDNKAALCALVCGSSRPELHGLRISSICCGAAFAPGLNGSALRSSQLMVCPATELTTSGRVTRQLNWSGD